MEPQQPQCRVPITGRDSLGEKPRCPLPAPRTVPPCTTLLISTHTAHLRGVPASAHPQGTPSRGTSASHDRCSSYVRGKQNNKQEGPCPTAQGQSASQTSVPMTHHGDSPVLRSLFMARENSRLRANPGRHCPSRLTGQAPDSVSHSLLPCIRHEDD